ncbi:hypothetical protein GSI_09214 [Ganoderma sinense ZZ0214-1]|uniref:Uncharacterized protein n=1 Tax=Ganoderma sinense ZZ0214-1 TaxID=1077348 RepID=A0A2G8S5Y9_9APHY|nr:hypothetical protein GSI_09214 [Ganoderma sinense ZZ0214-1]
MGGWVEEKGRISMSLINVAALGVGGRPLRVKVYNKFKNAIALVVTRGAAVERDPDGSKRIVFRDEEAGPSWVLRDWTYMCRPDPRVNLMPYTELIPAIRRALRDIHVPGQRLEKEWGAPSALQVARLLGSLGPLGGDAPAQKPVHKIDRRKVQVSKLLDELAKQGVTEPESAVVPPGHVLLERLLKRYKALLTEMRTEGVAEAERSTLSSQPPPGATSSQPKTSSGPSAGRDFGHERQQARDLNVMDALPGREVIKARRGRQVNNHGSNVAARKQVDR